MLSSVHFLLTYTCLYECDHCFLCCGPRAEGTFTLDRLEEAFKQCVEADIESVEFEGGEPFLYYPILLEGLRLAQKQRLKTGIVTNCYWATSVRDSEAWLRPLCDAGLGNLAVSDDAFHSEDPKQSPAKKAQAAAKNLGLCAGAICINPPTVKPKAQKAEDGAVVGGDVLFKGRAAQKLTADLPKRTYTCFDECPHEELENPSRVHVDPFGNVFVCQGISIGNIWRKPLFQVMTDYNPKQHPIIGPLLEGGPAQLARAFGLPDGEAYVDHCHLCVLTREKLLDKFPEHLCPRQIYGDKSSN